MDGMMLATAENGQVICDQEKLVCDKISDPALLTWLSNKSKGTDDKTSVILLIALPDDEVKIIPGHAAKSRPKNLPLSSVTVEPRDTETDERIISEAQNLVREVVGEEGNFIKSAGAMVVSVNAEEITELAKSPLVQRILPNREFKMKGFRQ